MTTLLHITSDSSDHAETPACRLGGKAIISKQAALTNTPAMVAFCLGWSSDQPWCVACSSFNGGASVVPAVAWSRRAASCGNAPSAGASSPGKAGSASSLQRQLRAMAAC